MSANNTVPTLMEMFSQDMNVDVPSPEVDLLEEGIIDSMMLVDLLFQIEARFNLSIPLDELDMDNLKSVRSIASYIDGKLAAEATA